MMLNIAPTSWLTWDFKVSDESRAVADVALSPWREKGELAIGGATYLAYREVPLFGDFILEGAGGVLARAEKPSAFRREFVIRHAGRECTLRSRSWFGRAFILLEGSREIGSITPTLAFARNAAAELPPDWPLPIRVFVVWLTMISWQRTDAGGGTGGC